MLSMIWAEDENGLIGKNGSIPWHLPADMHYFKQITINHTVIMGKNTYLSLGKPLINRKNIVLSHSLQVNNDNVRVFDNLDLLKQYINKQKNEIFVIGGAHLYQQFLPIAQRLYVTKIHNKFDGDTYAPKFSLDEWILVKKEEHSADQKNNYSYDFTVFDRILK